MIYADKENLKTQVSKDLLVIREREMDFYARNLSMVGTHAALLAGFAFTILSQHQFMTPEEGFLAYETEVSLGMWVENSTISTDILKATRTGITAWPWNTVIQQLFQLLHLIFTTLGIMLHLWTVYTTVVTNILGLHLALRGPEGSVDRAVRHMAQQNQFALRKFMIGLILFILSVLFFALSEYHVFISIWICLAICVLAGFIYQHIRELVASFFLPEESMVTGQWFDADVKSTASMAAGKREAVASALASAAKQRRASVSCMGNMLAFTPNNKPKPGSNAPAGALGSSCMLPMPNPDGKAEKRATIGQGLVEGKVGSKAVQRLLTVTRLRKEGQGTRWATAAGWNSGGGNSMIVDQVSTVLEEQVPSTIAEKLIFRQQNAEPGVMQNAPAPLRRGRSGTCFPRGRAWTRGSSRYSENRDAADKRNATHATTTDVQSALDEKSVFMPGSLAELPSGIMRGMVEKQDSYNHFRRTPLGSPEIHPTGGGIREEAGAVARQMPFRENACPGGTGVRSEAVEGPVADATDAPAADLGQLFGSVLTKLGIQHPQSAPIVEVVPSFEGSPSDRGSMASTLSVFQRPSRIAGSMADGDRMSTYDDWPELERRPSIQNRWNGKGDGT